MEWAFGIPYLEFDFDVVALDSDFIADDVSRCRRAPYGAARDVEDGPVPRAGHFCAFKHSLGEGSASVGTGFVNHINVPSTLKSAIFFPPASTSLPSPGAITPVVATLTKFPIAHLPVLMILPICAGGFGGAPGKMIAVTKKLVVLCSVYRRCQFASAV